ncbi:NAD(P)/FAD-dependent oxidoreductase [uncultured Mesonia sp.]|uniref:NAD(P)/FAD-dependent oxidoreductase n=1 Tax=uncultured Mesonia sp. TaxID=399731 RepID=UPI00374E6BFD
MKKVNYLIVGYGLAGFAVHQALKEAKRSFHVIDAAKNPASLVAGGLVNPIVLKKFNMSWKGEYWYEQAIKVYQSFEPNPFTPMPFLRPFKNKQEQNDWFMACERPKAKAFLASELVKILPNSLQAEHQAGQTQGTGLLNIAQLLQNQKNELQQQKAYTAASFDYQQLAIREDGVQYANIKADKLVFCEGAQIKNNPYFKDLPIVPNKGEYLIIHSPQLQLEQVVKAGYFIIPLGDNRYKVGATYARKFEDEQPSASAKSEIIKKLKQIINCDFKVVDQLAGVRPTLGDRKPVMGRHQKHEQLYVLNGFGSRGILYAPEMGRMLVAYSEKQQPLPSELAIERFYASRQP